MNENALNPAPSKAMTKPYWLEGEKLRREAVLVDGDLVWELFCACADGDNDRVRQLLAQDRSLMHGQLWYCKPIDLALRHGHLDVVRTMHEFDYEQKLAFYLDNFTTYRCIKPALERRNHTHILKYLEEEYWPRLVPHHVPEMDEIAKLFPKPWDKDRAIDREKLFTAVKRNPKLLTGTTWEGHCLLNLSIGAWNLELAEELVALGAATNRKTAENRSLVDIAASRCVKAIPWLLELGVAPSIRSAVASGDAGTVRAMAAEDPEILNRDSPLYLAVRHRQRDMVALLLELGADPNFPDMNSSWGTALAHAAEKHDVEIMRLLLEAGANPNAVVDSSGSVYDFLTNWERRSAEEVKEAVELLVDYGANPVEFGVEESKGMVHFLETASTEEILAVNEDGTSLSGCDSPEKLNAYVARVGNERIAKGPWYEMCKCPSNVELLKCAVGHGLDVNQGDWFGRTQLHAAAASNQLERATALLELGADPNLVDSHSSGTPLGFAAREGHAEMVKLLLEHGAEKRLPAEDHLAWARPLESANFYLADYEFRYKESTSNQGELTGRYSKASKEQYEAVIALLASS